MSEPAKKKPFTVKQQRFIKLFNGNIAETCKMCKISLAYGNKLVNDSRIQKKLQERENNRNRKHIATRQERQEFWTKAMNFDMRGFYNKGGSLKPYKDLDPELARLVQSIKVTKDGEEVEYKLPDRLKASEHLARSEADFTDTKRHVGADGKDLNWKVELVESKENNSNG